MIAFVEMLIEPAQAAGISVPDNVRKFERNAYPHFAVFRALQCGTSVPSWDAVWHNAKVIAMIPESFIEVVTISDIVALGWRGYQHQDRGIEVKSGAASTGTADDTGFRK